jgi:acyl-CoA hydrolase
MVVRTHEEAARAICDRGDGLRIVSPMYPSQPNALLAAIVAEARRRHTRVTILLADLSGRFPFVEASDVDAGTVSLITIGGRSPRRLSGRVDNVPTSLWEIARRLGSGQLPVDVYVGYAAPAGPDGYHSMGPMVSYAPAAFAAAPLKVIEVNRAILPTPGYRGPHRNDIDLLVDAGTNEIGEFPAPKVSADHQRIGANLAALIPDGATLQLGIGGIPEGFVRALADKKGLSIHSGAIPESALDLIEAGVFTGRHVTTCLLGTRRLYAFAADPKNRIELHPVTLTHDPKTLAAVPTFYAVNSAFEVDLSGQVNAEVVDGRRASSGGGQVDFGKWAHAGDGANILALPARSTDGRPRIVPSLSPPYVVTTHRSDVDYVVTEFGVADLRGRTVDERSRALIDIAHPDDRVMLAAAARAGMALA